MRRKTPVAAVQSIACTLLLTAAAAAAEPSHRQSLEQAVELFLAEDLHSPKTTATLPRPLTSTTRLSDWMRLSDPWAAAFTAEEFRAIRRSTRPEYGGVQMNLQQLADGSFRCHPLRNGAAYRAGVRENDRLAAVNGRPVDGRLLQLVGMEIRGEVGTTVSLTVEHHNRPPRTITLQRVRTSSRSAGIEFLGDNLVYRIYSFTATTPQELASLLRFRSDGDPVVVDLRGNPGGSLQGAIKSAALFLERGREIVTIKTGKGLSIRRLSRTTQPFTFPLLLLQNRHTASAAEVFIAALVQNHRAVSVGETTFGKGESQKFVRLADGSALKLSYARLLPPAHMSYHNRGLAPTIPIEAAKRDDDASDTRAFLRRVDEIITAEMKKRRTRLP